MLAAGAPAPLMQSQEAQPVKKKPAGVDWSQWADDDESDGKDSQNLSGCEEVEKEEGGRSRTQTVDPGKDFNGEALPTNNSDAYSREQKYVLDKLMEENGDRQSPPPSPPLPVILSLSHPWRTGPT